MSSLPFLCLHYCIFTLPFFLTILLIVFFSLTLSFRSSLLPHPFRFYHLSFSCPSPVCCLYSPRFSNPPQRSQKRNPALAKCWQYRLRIFRVHSSSCSLSASFLLPPFLMLFFPVFPSFLPILCLCFLNYVRPGSFANRSKVEKARSLWNVVFLADSTSNASNGSTSGPVLET